MPPTQVEVRGYWERRPGVPAVGLVSFVLTAEIRDGTGLLVAAGETVRGSLVAGHVKLVETAGPVMLWATDDPSTMPAGVAWRVEERLDGTKASWLLAVPFNTPAGVLDLATVAPAVPVVPVYGYVTTAQLFGILGGISGGDAAASGSLLLSGGGA